MEERDSIHKGFKIFIIVFTIIALLYINREGLVDVFQGENADFSLIEAIEDDYDYRFFNGEIIKYNDIGIAHLEDFKEITVQKDFTFSEPRIIFGNQYIYYSDGEKGDIYILNNKLETMGQANLNMNIFNIVETDNYIMVHSKEDIESLYSINSEGNILYKNSPDNSIITYDMGNNSYGFVTLNIDREIKSRLHIYDFQGQLIKNMDFDEEVIFNITYADDKIVLLTDKALYMIDREILWKNDYPLIKNILIGQEEIKLLYSNTLETLDYRGETLETVEFQEDYDMIVAMDNGLILYGEEDILAIKDDENFKLSLEDSINSVSGQGNYLIVNTDQYTNIYEFEARE